MNDNTNQIIASGYPQGSGSSAKYVFTCHSCGSQVVTQNDHPTGQGGLLSNTLSSQAQYGLSSLLWRIPIVGSILSSLVSGKISEHQSQGTQQKMEEAKRQAFEEVRNRFSQCTRCGTMACSSCFSNGLCRTCQATEQAQRPSADQQKGGQEGGPQGGSSDPTKMWE
jgi:hypothetical protein